MAQAALAASSAIASASAVLPLSKSPAVRGRINAPRRRPVRRISFVDQALATSMDVSTDSLAESWTEPTLVCP